MKLSPQWRHRLVHSALARIVIFLLLLGALGGAAFLVAYAAGLTGDSAGRWPKIAGALLRMMLPTIGAYLLLVRFVEKRRANELAPARLLPDALKGMAGGAALIGTVVGTLWLAGAYRVTGINDDVRWAGGLLLAGLGAGVAEELIFRGVLFRIVEEGLGFGWALGISAAFFGAVHLGNPGATWWSALAIAIEAGVLLGVVFHVTRSLWTCMGLHMAWNVLQGTIFGSAVSGTGGASHSLLAAQFSGPDWLTGGAFGIEASVLTVAFSLAGSIALLAAQHRRAADNGRVAVGASAC